MSRKRGPTTQQLKVDFRNYLWYIWRFLGLPDPTPVQYDIAEYLQHGPDRCIIWGYRGVGKSWITSAFVTWLLWRDPQEKILVVSASKDRSDAFSTFTKRLIYEVPLLQHLKPRPDQRTSNVAFDVGPATPDHSPSVKSVGIFGQLTGSRANYIIPDDVEVANNSLTQTMRDRLQEAVKEFEAILKPGGRICYLGTPQTEMSVYLALAERGYEVRIWPARYPKPKLLEAYQGRLAPKLVQDLKQNPSLAQSPHSDRYGQPTDPKRFDELELKTREAVYGRSGFALQFMLDPSVSDADRYPLKLRDLMVFGTSPDMSPVKFAWGSGPDQELGLQAIGLAGDRLYRPAFVSEHWDEYQGATMHIDPSGRGKDETAYVVLKYINGFLVVRRLGGFLGGYEDDVLKQLANIAKAEKVTDVYVEDNFGGGMFAKLLEPVLIQVGHPATVHSERAPSKQKELRIIDTLEPVMTQHRLVVDEGILQDDLRHLDDPKYTFSYQLTRLTRDRGALPQDDRVDVLAAGVAHWTEQMNRDVYGAEEQHLERLREQELRKFMESVLGRPPATPNWTDVL